MAKAPPQQQQNMTQNEAISGHAKLAQVLGGLESRRDEISAVLPSDVSFDAFSVSVNQALRNNVRLLKCTTPSLINACIKAAYDGLKIDGKEAAIVDAQESYQEGGKWHKRTVARYMPMVFGLIKQILQSGLVLDVKAVIVYSAEEATGRFELLEGTNPGIYHKPILHGDKGEMIGAYSIALLKSGARVFEWMDRAAIEDVKKESKTDQVWSRWPTEMWKKTVVRRHRKTLPSTNDVVIRDMEARELFPQFDRETPHPQLASAPPRPTRGALQHHGGESGTAMDFGGGGGDEVVIDGRGEQQQAADQKQVKQQAVKNDDPPAQEMPADGAEWAMWEAQFKKDLKSFTTTEDVNKLWADEMPRIEAFAKKDDLIELLNARLTDIAVGGDD